MNIKGKILRKQERSIAIMFININNEQEKWLYSMNSKVPYGAMYVSTTTPDGFKVDGSGAKVAEETAAQSGNTNASSGTQTTKNGWVSENGSWYYYDKNGKKFTKTQKIILKFLFFFTQSY